MEICFFPVYSIKRYGNSWRSSSCVWRWCLTNNSICLNKSSSNYMITNFTECENSVFRFLHKPSSCNSKISSSRGKTTVWLNLIHWWLFIEEKFQIWAIMEHCINRLLWNLATWTLSVIDFFKFYSFTNLNVNFTKNY